MNTDDKRLDKIRKPDHVIQNSTEIKTWPYFITMGLMIIAYFLLSIRYDQSLVKDIISMVFAIIAAVAFWMEYKHSRILNEAKFIMDLNNQFLSNSELTDVEWELEKYHAKYMELKKAHLDTSKIQFDVDFSLSNRERQSLVNYLVHLEGVAAMVNRGVLHLNVITDLMAYRYFIAVNDPIVQELELIPFASFYQGCYSIYERWEKEMTDIPLAEYALNQRINRS